MNWLAISLYVPLLLGVVVIIRLAYDAFRGKRVIQGLRFVEATIVFYFVLLYGRALFGFMDDGGLDYMIRSGILTRIGITLLFIVLLIDVEVGRRNCG